VLEAVRANSAISVLVASDRRSSAVLMEIVKEARKRGIRLREVPLQEVEQLAPNQTSQGVAAEVLEHRLDDVQELLSILLGKSRHRQAKSPTLHPVDVAPTEQPFLLALDQIQDPQNFGALLRTADAAGVQGIIVPEKRSAHVTGVVAKSSAGAVSHLPILEVTNLVRALQEVRQANIWTVGLEGGARELLFEVDLNIPLVLVMGSEGSGLRRLVRETCDFLVRLPMFGSIESLNASVAGSIAMYEVVRQRGVPETIE
jgi:23S rRNA (guanosine2251-2'-O)-methyltransferase